MSPSRSRKRRFQPVKVDILGHELGAVRFTKDGFHSPPQVSPWRNNLTVLSQRHNLYFLASGDKIHVYVPDFYTQRLGDTPRLILSPQPAEPHAAGYLNESQPHGVNHLVIGDLGRDEILCLTTDSGNVIAYHTSTIARTIERSAENNLPLPVEDTNIRPFFAHWVFESAWGIAIHKAARLIAVSANVPHHVESDEQTAKITVFAFALTSQPSSGNESVTSNNVNGLGESDNEEWPELEDQTILHEQLMFRTRNVKLVLSEHTANIPNISFVNNHLDREGKWLISTDIDGEMKVWRIWDREVHRSYNFSESGWGTRLSRRRCEMGWSVLALDPSSFRKMMTMEEFCGQSDPSEYYPSSSGSYIGGPRESYLLGTANAFPEDSDEESEAPEQPLLATDISDNDDEGNGGVSLVEQEEEEEEEDTASQSSGQAELANPNTSGTSGDRHTSGLPVDSPTPRAQRAVNPVVVSSGDTSSRAIRPQVQIQEDSSTMTLAEIADDESEEDLSERENLEQFALSGSPPVQLISPQSQMDSLLSPRHSWSAKEASDVNAPHFPILHCSVSNIRLIQSPQAYVPHVFLTEPIVQYFPPSVSYMYNMERLSMTAYLPDIGVAVIASQAGKVVLLTLTKRSETGCLGVRVDTVLPSEEEEDIAPKYKPLLGMAVSPIQGRNSSLDNDTVPNIDDESPYATDQIVDGVPCTFDPDFLSLDEGKRPRAASFTDSSTSDSEQEDLKQQQSSTATSLPHRSPRTPPKRKTFSSPRTKANRQLPTPPRLSNSLISSARSSKPGKKKPRTDVTRSSDIHPDTSASTSAHLATGSTSSYPVVSTPWVRSRRSLQPLIEGGHPKRYRLLLTYYDHTVLSYEIRRVNDKLGIWGSERRNWKNREDFVI